MKTSLALVLAMTLTGAAALAQEASTSNTSSVKSSDVKKNEEQRSNLDQEITNARLRAEAGSKSKWSVKANLSYSGGSVEKPLDRLRPNYRAGAAQDVRTSLAGTLGLAYRASDKLTVRAGTGVSMVTPFHVTDKDLRNNQFEGTSTKVMTVATPYLEASSAFRTGNIMHMPEITYSHFSKQFDVETLQKLNDITLSHTLVAEIPGSGWQPGVTASAYVTFYKDAPNRSAEGDVIGSDNARDDGGVGLYPFVEYAFNDRYSFRTLLGFTYTHLRAENERTFTKDTVYQSMGVGIALTKEIYFYPNVQFIPEDIRGDRTNVGLSTTLNVF